MEYQQLKIKSLGYLPVETAISDASMEYQQWESGTLTLCPHIAMEYQQLKAKSLGDLSSADTAWGGSSGTLSRRSSSVEEDPIDFLPWGLCSEEDEESCRVDAEDEEEEEEHLVSFCDGKEEQEEAEDRASVEASASDTAKVAVEEEDEVSASRFHVAVTSISIEIMEFLALSLLEADEAVFQEILGSLRMDDTTQKYLMEELEVDPCIRKSEVDRLLLNTFQSKVDQLRSLGLGATRRALDRLDLVPEAFKTTG
jgi:hypothetical protein